MISSYSLIVIAILNRPRPRLDQEGTHQPQDAHRKRKLSYLTGHKITYLGFPSFAFMVGKLVVTKDGTVEGVLSQQVLKGLEKAGFRPANE